MNVRSTISFLKELFYFLPLPTHTPDDWNDFSYLDTKKPIVILVSGFGASERTLTVIRKRLMRDGYNVLVLALDWQNLSDGVKGLKHVSERLSHLVLQLKKHREFRTNKVFIVAHSAGGLVARYYIQSLGGSHYCNGLVTMATPHSGTWFAGLGLLTHLILKARCLIQMLPFSGFIHSLNKSDFPSEFKILSLFSTDDILCPISATKLPKKILDTAQVETLGLKHLSHGEFLLSKKSYSAIQEYLRSQLGLPSVPIESRTSA